MRMTNKIMQGNSLYNINQNKVLQDKLSTQMSTQKKLTRPSDDPVVAIRALRLRTSVSEVSQYSEKNANDAKSWLKVTADGLGTVNDILTDLSRNANKAANKDLTSDDLDIIITQMKSLTNEFYATGNLDYAGRYVFTGFRTDTPMSFTASDIADTKNPIPTYSITEQLGLKALDTVKYTDIGKLSGITESNYLDASHKEVEQSVENGEIHRLRLAYDELTSGKAVTLEYVTGYDTTGNAQTTTLSGITNKTEDEAYKAILAANKSGAAEAYYIPETGEILFSDSYYKTNIEPLTINPNFVELRATYEKSEWENGDLRPEHYFNCTTYDEDGNKLVDYNQSYITEEGKEKQVIAYDVGYNQTIEINTTADEVFNHSLSRDISDLSAALNSLKEIEEIKKTLDTKLSNMEETNPAYDDVNNQLDAANKAYTYIRENMHDLMQGAITKMQNYLDSTNVAVTDNGTRSSRLELISNRLVEQKTTFRTLQSENEDVDIADVAIKLSSAELTYEASLTATSKIMQTTLMNYI